MANKNLKKYLSLEYWETVPIFQDILHFSKTKSIPGLRGVPIFNVIKFLIQEAKDDNIVTRANSVTFSFFVALFPSIIFLFTLLPMIPTVANYALDIRESVHGLLPEQSEEYIFSIVDDIVSQKRGGLLSFGLVLAIFFASNGMLSLISGFEKQQHNITFKSRSWIKKRFVAVVLTIVVSFLFIISSSLIVLGSYIINYLDNLFDLDDWAVLGFGALRWLIIVLLIYNIIAIIYRYAPTVHRKFSYFSLGTNVATFLIIAVSVGFSYFVSNFGRYNEIYGSIGTLIVTLLWFNLICFVLIVGFEINASVAVNRDLIWKEKNKDENLMADVLNELDGPEES